jgi:hypothetical protein
MDENVLSNEDIQRLRQQGVITESEIATRQGDLLVAVDVVTQARRIIEAGGVTESVSSKRLLRG